MADNLHEDVSIERWDVSQSVIDVLAVELPSESDTLLLLPIKVDSDGSPLYRDDDAGFVKTARWKNIPLKLATGRSPKRYVSEYSAGEVIVQIMLGVIGNLTTDQLKSIAALTRIKLNAALSTLQSGDSSSDRVKISIAELELSEDKKARGVSIEVPIKYFDDNDEKVGQIIRAIWAEHASQGRDEADDI